MLEGWPATFRDEIAGRVREHRLKRYQVKLEDENGQPIANQRVKFDLVKPAFLCGTAVGGKPWDKDDPKFGMYGQWMAENFNTLVCENAMKWYSTEKRQGEYEFETADRLLDFAENAGLKMRGHCLLWSKRKFIRPWVQALTDAELRKAVEEHIYRSVSRYAGRLSCWDMNNEMLNGSFYADRLGDEFRSDIFLLADSADPGTPLFVNEYDILSNEQRQYEYIELIEALQTQGAPVGGIGIQEHAAERMLTQEVGFAGEVERLSRDPLSPQLMWSALDRMSRFNLPIHLTEISCKHPDETLRAKALELFLWSAFAHPCVECVMLWGFWASHHWLGREAALVDHDFSLLPSGEILRNLMHEHWRTHVTVKTDAAGQCSFDGYAGAYEIYSHEADWAYGEGRCTPDESQSVLCKLKFAE